MKPLVLQTVAETKAALLYALAKHHAGTDYAKLLEQRALAALGNRAVAHVPEVAFPAQPPRPSRNAAVTDVEFDYGNMVPE